ncbi:aryl-alcohol dehydrogenase-like predicted oxidoreductase [Streptomyces sp. 3211.6]|uniref:aldo/keto reductase n=1 Tax=Streptomyces TaxID=1883 RepID=UPI0009A47F8C|nr:MULTISPECIES: aldo/keto reductase [Streptomyces]RKT02537.1 aryl-alcohol dehydrogenase-like predicted oxidoreductase [Streptomyces sp. 3211.6]RPF43862.1 aryl-alcohol dehydrogenase-like predicted oxidoreductase [Streptomyces sp. Ag109_G2-6]
MELRALGSQGLHVGAEGLGCMGMSAFYGATDEAESLATIDRALELGVTLLDTAEAYGPFVNEQLVGKAVAGRRDQVVIATKTGIEIDDNGTVHGHNGRRAYIHRAAERSLRHLGTDYIDLYYLHRIDPDVPVEESIGAMAELVTAGKVRYLGISEAAAATIRRAHAVHPLTAVQTEYSLFERGLEDNGVQAALDELGIGLVAYSPLGRGFLSGAITSPDDFAEDDFRRTDPRFQGENFSRNLAVVDAVRRLAEAKSVTPSQLALAWVLHRGAVPIPGTKRRRYLEENVAATTVTITEEDIAAIEAVAPRGVASGDRYSPEYMRNLNG